MKTSYVTSLALTFTILTSVDSPRPAMAQVPTPPPPVGVPAPPSAVEPTRPAGFGEDVNVPRVGPARTSATVRSANRNYKVDLETRLTSSRSDRTLIIHDEAPEPAIHAEWKEDLNIMAIVLQKAVESGSNSEERAMGINLHALSSSKAPRHLRIPGYGVIFTFQARFPLKAPAAGRDGNPTNNLRSDWDQARRELYGRGNGPDGQPQFDFLVTEEREYDATRVERLKEALLAGLKNATHIRHLGPEESVSVVITSGVSAADPTLSFTDKSGNERGMVTRAPSTSRSEQETQMVITARKVDIDALAKGSMTLEEFQRKVQPLIY